MSETPRPGAGGAETALLDSALGALSAPQNGPGLSVSLDAVRRFAMTVSGRIEGAPDGPGFDPSQAHAVCTISDRNAPDEPPLEGVLKMSEDGGFTFTVLLEAWPEERYPQGRLFVITVRARDRAGTLGTSTTYLPVPPAAAMAKPPRADDPDLARAGAAVPDELLADAAARPQPAPLPLHVKGLHLAIKELKQERSSIADGASD